MSVTETVEPVLSESQIAEFDETGMVIMRGVLSRDEAARYRDLILDMVPRNLVLPETWEVNAGRLKPHRGVGKPMWHYQTFDTPEFLPLMMNEIVYRAATQLLDDHRLRVYDGSLGITLRNDKGSTRSQYVHIDSGVPAEVDNFLLAPEEVEVGGCFYLSDVEPLGGGLHVVPGGHRLVMEKSRQDPLGRHLYNDWSNIDDFPETVEVTAEAGDFIMHHYLMPHASSNNRKPTPRVAHFTRYRREDHPYNPATPAPPERFDIWQRQAMTPVGRKLLGVDPW